MRWGILLLVIRTLESMIIWLKEYVNVARRLSKAWMYPRSLSHMAMLAADARNRKASDWVGLSPAMRAMKDESENRPTKNAMNVR